MDLKGAVQKHMYDAINSAPVSGELKRAATKHHKFVEFQQALYKQILDVELLRKRQGKSTLKPKTVQELIYSFVHTYLTGVETEATRMAESDIARTLREQKEQKAKDLEASSNSQTFVGEYAELQEGLTTSDERDIGL